MQAKLLTLLMAAMVVCSATIAQNLPDYVPQDDLLGWFSMDGNADDLSPLQHHGLTSGPIAWGADRFGNPTAALDLSAEGGDYVDLPASLDSSFTNAMTVACWVNYPAEPGQTIFRSGSAPGLYDNFQALIWDHVGLQQMTLRLYTESGYYTSYPYPEEEQWKHLTMMVQEDLVKLFVNGQLVHEHSGNPFDNSPGIFRIGESMFANPYDYRGSIDDFGVWNRALSTEEVELLYSETPIVQGCNDDAACNYSPGANVNDGSCTYPLIAGDCNAGAVACSEGMYWNPLVQQCMPTTCPTCPADVDQDNVIGVSDLLQMLSLFGGVCPEGGCTDPQAMNYDPLVGFNDGSCIYPPCLDALDPFGPCDDGNSNTFNDALDADGCLCEGDDYVAEDGSGPCEGVSTLNFFGHEYQLVEIGDQCWFAENSRNAQYTNGDSLLTGLGDEVWSTQLEGAATAYGEGEGMCGGNFATGYNACDADFTAENFGWLYNYFAVADDRGLCPTGWSVASDDDWKVLESHLGVPQSELDSTGYRGTNQGTLLKSTGLWYAGGNGTDSLGFSAPPGGYKHYDYGGDVDLGYNANFWTTTPWAANTATKRTLYFNQTGIARGAHNIRQGHSIRCIKLPAASCYDPDGDGVCPEDEISGCTDPTACNYEASATHDDGSCVEAQEPGSVCDDGDSNTFNDVWDDTGCSCAGVPAVAEDGSGPCEGQMTVNYHGYDYLLVEIGDRCWSRENARYLPAVSPGNIGGESTNDAPHAYVYGYYGDSLAEAMEFAGRYDTYGVLYNYYAAYQWDVCPVGWHVAWADDWRSLETALGLPDSLLATGAGANGSTIGTQLKDNVLWNGENTSGFSLLGGGYREVSGNFHSLNYSGHYRALVPQSFYAPPGSGIAAQSNWTGIDRGNTYENKGFSVRCVKGEATRGCINPNACNFDEAAQLDDGSCVLPKEPGSACDDGDSNSFNDVWDETGCNCSGSPAVAPDGSGPCEGQVSVNYHGIDYDLVEIADQCWFRENLKTLRYQNGDSIQLVLGDEEWSAAEDAAVTYRPDSLQTLIHGYYYNWWAVTSETGICPTGWRSPSHQDWSDLEFALGMDSIQAYSLGYSRGMSENIASIMLTAGSNASGFSATGNGYRSESGAWGNTYTVFWTSDNASNSSGAITRKMLGVNNGVTAVLDPMKWGAAVRCIKEDTD